MNTGRGIPGDMPVLFSHRLFARGHNTRFEKNLLPFRRKGPGSKSLLC